MEKINRFFTELCRCEDANPYYIEGVEWGYNGMAQTCWLDGYHNYIRDLYNNALDSLPLLTEDAKVIYATRLKEIEELQNYFEVPTQEVLDGMEREYISNKNVSLKEEIEHVRFIIGCVSLQRYYRSMFSRYIYLNNIGQHVYDEEIKDFIPEQDDMQNKTVKRAMEDDNSPYIRGIEGLANYLKIGKNSAQTLRNKGIVVPAQFPWGDINSRLILFKKEEVDKALFDSPEYHKIKEKSEKLRNRKSKK